MTTMEKTPIMNPASRFCALEDIVLDEGFIEVGEISNEEYLGKDFNLYEYLAQKGYRDVRDFRVLPSDLAKDGSEIEGSRYSHNIYIKE